VKSSVSFVVLVILIVALLGVWSAANPSLGPIDLQLQVCAPRALGGCLVHLQNGGNLTWGSTVLVSAVLSSPVTREYDPRDYTVNTTIQQINGNYRFVDDWQGRYWPANSTDYSLSPGGNLSFSTVWNTSATVYVGPNRGPPPPPGTFQITSVLYDANGRILATSTMVLELVQRPSA